MSNFGRPDKVLENVVHPKRMPEAGDDVEEKRVATDIAEMFAKQVGRSLHIARWPRCGGPRCGGAPSSPARDCDVGTVTPVVASRSQRASSKAGAASTARRSALVTSCANARAMTHELGNARLLPRPRSDSHDEPGSALVAQASWVTTIR